MSGQAGRLRGMLEDRFRERGTRFLVYPQPSALPGFLRPVRVYVNAVPSSIQPGPADDRLYVVDAHDKRPYYGTRRRPPYAGLRYPPAEPDADGHFDHLTPGTRAFASAAVYAAVRCVLDVWEGYFGRQLPWYFRSRYRRLEVIPRIHSANAFSRPGYVEFGAPGRRTRYGEHFDVVAHEAGHAILWSVIPTAPPRRRSLECRAHEEGAADLIALVTALHFAAVVDRLLATTEGNLFSPNVLARIGELGRTRYARSVFNRKTLSDVVRARLLGDKHALSLPFTGGAFEVLVEIYEQGLVARGAIPEALGTRSSSARHPRDAAPIQRAFGRYFRRRPRAFREALLEARDAFGRLLARTWELTPARRLSFRRVARRMLAADAALSGGRYAAIIRAAFERREILPPSRRVGRAPA